MGVASVVLCVVDNGVVVVRHALVVGSLTTGIDNSSEDGVGAKTKTKHRYVLLPMKGY